MTAEEKLAAIAKAYDTVTTNPDGSTTSTHARHNLLGAFLDLRRLGKADEVCLQTIDRVMDQLYQIEEILEK